MEPITAETFGITVEPETPPAPTTAVPVYHRTASVALICDPKSERSFVPTVRIGEGKEIATDGHRAFIRPTDYQGPATLVHVDDVRRALALAPKVGKRKPKDAVVSLPEPERIPAATVGGGTITANGGATAPATVTPSVAEFPDPSNCYPRPETVRIGGAVNVSYLADIAKAAVLAGCDTVRIDLPDDHRSPMIFRCDGPEGAALEVLQMPMHPWAGRHPTYGKETEALNRAVDIRRVIDPLLDLVRKGGEVGEAARLVLREWGHPLRSDAMRGAKVAA